MKPIIIEAFQLYGEGSLFIAKEADMSYHRCLGCAFCDDEHISSNMVLCKNSQDSGIMPYCASAYREDGKNVIFVEEVK